MVYSGECAPAGRPPPSEPGPVVAHTPLGRGTVMRCHTKRECASSFKEGPPVASRGRARGFAGWFGLLKGFLSHCQTVELGHPNTLESRLRRQHLRVSDTHWEGDERWILTSDTHRATRLRHNTTANHSQLRTIPTYRPTTDTTGQTRPRPLAFITSLCLPRCTALRGH